MTAPLRIALVEDDSKLRADFAALVSSESDMTCVAAFATAEDALRGLPAARAGVLLVDINLPGMSGIDLVRKVRASGAAVQILMLTTFDDTTSVFESLTAGANGYVLKRAVLGELPGAIRDVVSGGAPMTGTIARKVVQFFGQRTPAPEVATLTAREHEVLLALSEGQQYKEIATALDISVNTVRNYIRGIYDKLHVTTRHEAVTKLGR
jgi:DNA-binding NarL/FixJ family response regulator